MKASFLDEGDGTQHKNTSPKFRRLKKIGTDLIYPSYRPAASLALWRSERDWLCRRRQPRSRHRSACVDIALALGHSLPLGWPLEEDRRVAPGSSWAACLAWHTAHGPQ